MDPTNSNKIMELSLSNDTIQNVKNDPSDKQPPSTPAPLQRFPLPTINGSRLEPLSRTEEEHETVLTFTASEALRTAYVRALTDDGFVPNKDSDIFVKISKNTTPAVVRLEEGEGEFVVRMQDSLDPNQIYKNIPDARIPLPLIDNVAAEFGDQHTIHAPEKHDQVVYTYFNTPDEFVQNYRQRLTEAGFHHTLLPRDKDQYSLQIENNTDLIVTLAPDDHQVEITMALVDRAK